MFCRKCGKEINENSKFCKYCGFDLTQYMENQNNSNQQLQEPTTVVFNNQEIYTGRVKKKWITFILWLFLGYIGIHKFYNDKYGVGIAYIIANATGSILIFLSLGIMLPIVLIIQAIVAIIDLIWILSLPEVYR